VRRGIDSFNDEAKDIIVKGWVTGVSAYSAVQISLKPSHCGQSSQAGEPARAIGHADQP